MTGLVSGNWSALQITTTQISECQTHPNQSSKSGILPHRMAQNLVRVVSIMNRLRTSSRIGTSRQGDRVDVAATREQKQVLLMGKPDSPLDRRLHRHTVRSSDYGTTNSH